MKNFSETTNFIWSIAELLRGDYKQNEYGKVTLPLNVLRRLEPTTISYIFNETNHFEEEMVANAKLPEQAQTNAIENIKYGFEDAFLASLISRMNQNQEIFTDIMDDEEFSSVMKKLLLEKVNTRLSETIQF